MKKNISRRGALRLMALSAVAWLVSCFRKDPVVNNVVSQMEPTLETASQTPSETETQPATETTESATPEAAENTPTQQSQKVSTVYMTTDISAEGLMNIFAALGIQTAGNVAVKISSGEPGGNYYLHPELIGQLVEAVDGTIVECNTAYGGGRGETEAHLQVMEDHGFTAIAPVDIMDADGSMSLPVEGGKQLSENLVGAHLADYDFVVNLAHFKGHAMAGYGGVIKNMSIGIASREGKCLIHTAGANHDFMWGGNRNDFLESMAEAAKSVAEYMGENILYINVMNNLSVDCDCDSHPVPPNMEDIGILASLDPVAVDQACIDLVYAAPDSNRLIQRIESRNGLLTLEHAAAIGLGSRSYEIVSID